MEVVSPNDQAGDPITAACSDLHGPPSGGEEVVFDHDILEDPVIAARAHLQRRVIEIAEAISRNDCVGETGAPRPWRQLQNDRGAATHQCVTAMSLMAGAGGAARTRIMFPVSVMRSIGRPRTRNPPACARKTYRRADR
jgi:hypothetical protein